MRMGTEDEAATCFVCRKHRGEVVVPGGPVYEDALVYAGHVVPEGTNSYLGWYVAEPKRHAPGLADVTDEEARALGLLVTRVSRALKAVAGAEHIYSFVLGHHVPHLHIHVIARYPGTPEEYRGIRVDEWPDAPRGGAEAVAALSERIRAFLATEP